MEESDVFAKLIMNSYYTIATSLVHFYDDDDDDDDSNNEDKRYEDDDSVCQMRVY